jgi:predicted DNA-binding transcriptional regulator YafY
MKRAPVYPIGHDYAARLEETKRITRIMQLVTMISNAPRRYTRRDLSAHFEIGERQLDNDFQQIRHGLKCDLRHSRAGYYFARLPELPPVSYTTPEALALITALQFAWDSGALDAASLAAALARTEGALN